MCRQTWVLVLILNSIAGTGCFSSTSSSTEPSGVNASSAAASTSSGAPEGSTSTDVDGAADSIGGGGQFQPFTFFPAQPTDAATNSPGEASAPPPTETIPAQVGVGSKGRSLDEHEGIIVTPAKTYFKAKERIAFEIAIPHALNLYKATNGEGPKSHDEFMQKIVSENQIKLPQLPAGHQYEYDPMTEQLMVRRPKK